MKRIIYLSIIVFYAGVGALGAAGNGYTEVGGSGRIIRNHLLLIILLTLFIGGLIAYYFPKIFPKGHAKQNKLGRIALPIMFLILSLVFTMGFFLFVNASIGKQRLVTVEGVIERKWYTTGYKSNNYFLGLRDSISGEYYEFKVKRFIYNQIGFKGDKISKDFYKGSLGIIYRYSF